MAREFARIKTNISDNPDWTNLTSRAQSLYINCLAHPTLTSAGVLDWRPGRLKNLAADWTRETIDQTAHELEAAGFLVIDRDAEYAFIRSFHRHDPFIRQSDRIGTSIANAITSVSSPYLKDHIAAELWRLHTDHPNYGGFRSAALMEFMNQRTGTPETLVEAPAETPPQTPIETPTEGWLETPVETPRKTKTTPQTETPRKTSPQTHVETPTETPIESHPGSMPEEVEEVEEVEERSDPSRGRGGDDRFDEFWNLVPRKAKKPAARKAFAAAVKRAEGGAQTVIDGMSRYADDPNLPDPHGPEARFILHPATWLNNDGWDDPPLPARGSAGNAGKSARGASPARSVAPGDLLGLMVGGGDGPTVIDGEIVDGEQGMIA